MKKRVSLLLVVAMLLSMLPFAAVAAEATELLSITNESVTASGYTFTHTFETAGTMNVSVGTCSPGWRYRIYYPDGTESIYRTKWSAGASCDYDVTPGTYKIVFYAYSSSEADNGCLIPPFITDCMLFLSKNGIFFVYSNSFRNFSNAFFSIRDT